MEFTKDGVTYSFKIANYGQRRNVNETTEEREVFDIIKEILEAEGYDIETLELVRKADQYVTAVYLDSDLARFKLSFRTSWIRFPYYEDGGKINIDDPDTVRDFTDDIIGSAESCIRMHNYTK